MSIKGKYCYFLIWGSGLEYSREIINKIRDDSNFDILKIKYHEFDDVGLFVKQIYSQDYAPIEHLKGKTEYLKGSEPRVMIIFVRNKHHHEKIFGKKKQFQHVECEYVKQFKEGIRDQFNPRNDKGERTHEHIVHASDSEYQVEHLLHVLGYKDGLRIFEKSNDVIRQVAGNKCNFANFSIKRVDVGSLYCSLYVGSRKKFHKEKKELMGTPHYKYVLGDKEEYKKYIDEFGGYELSDDHFVESFDKLQENFSYLEGAHSLDYIVVKEFQMGNFIILDGVHRACILKKGGAEEIIVAVIRE